MKGIVQIVQKKGAIFLQKKIFFLIYGNKRPLLVWYTLIVIAGIT